MPAPREDDALKVFISNRDSSCDACGEELGRKAWIMLAGERGALCLACADLVNPGGITDACGVNSRTACGTARAAGSVCICVLAGKEFLRVLSARR